MLGDYQHNSDVQYSEQIAPTQLPSEVDYDIIRRGVERGKLVVMTTQVPNEGSDLTVYHVGGHLKHTLQVLEAYDMTTESAVCKLMWILGQTRDFAQAEKLFYTPVSRDILRFSGE